MRHRFQPLSHLAVASFAWLAVARAGAQLATSSPFLPPKSAASSSSATPDAPLEFRGQFDSPDGGLRVRIYDPARKAGAWLRLNEHDPNFDFVVRQYDAARGTVSVEYHGQTLVLAQHEAKVTSLGAAGFSLSTAAVPLPSAVMQPTTVAQTPAEEQRRLEEVAQEVARRRQLREQAAAPAAAPSPGTPQAPPPSAAASRGNNPGRTQ